MDESWERRARLVRAARPFLDRLTGADRHPVPWRFDPLATYNAERARGIVHTPEYTAQMARLQAEFNRWRREESIRELGEDGLWGVPGGGASASG